jgi:tyrosyl-tRNA synthetase
MPIAEITEIMQDHERDQSKRVAQHRLAQEFVELIHGEAKAKEAEEQHRSLHKKTLTISDIKASVADSHAVETHPRTGVPIFAHPSLNKYAQPLHREDDTTTNIRLPYGMVTQSPMNSILWYAGLVTSKTEGHRLIKAGGAYVGSAADAKQEMGDSLSFTPVKYGDVQEVHKRIIDNSLLILRSGKWRIKIITMIPDEEYAQLGLQCPGWKEYREQHLEKLGNASEAEGEPAAQQQ